MLVSFHVRAAGFFADRTQAEANFLLFGVHLDDLEVVFLSGFQFGWSAAGVSGFRVMAEPFNTLCNFHESAELGQPQNFAVDHITNAVCLKESLPGVGLKLLYAQ